MLLWVRKALALAVEGGSMCCELVIDGMHMRGEVPTVVRGAAQVAPSFLAFVGQGYFYVAVTTVVHPPGHIDDH